MVAVHLDELAPMVARRRGRFVKLVGPRGQRVGVVGDEVLLDPSPLIRLHAELQHRLIDVVEKRFGIGRRWSGCRRRASRATRAGHEQVRLVGHASAYSQLVPAMVVCSRPR